MTRPCVALTIAGSDPSGGAGVQADLKTFSALGAYGTSVLTALTAQSTRSVTGTFQIPSEFVTEQLYTLVEDVQIDAIKIGMLATSETTDAVAAFLTEYPHEVVVLDPVMASTGGHPLLTDDAIAAIWRLMPLTSLVTPNLREAAYLLRTETASNVGEMLDQARKLRDGGAVRVLVKGGHLAGRDAIDVLVGPEGEDVVAAPWVETVNTHGTGCALSSAVAVLRARCGGWPKAVTEAKQWLSVALRAGRTLNLGHGHGPVHHMHAMWGR